jgi:peptide deformylase
MSVLNIIKIGHTILRKIAEPVDIFDNDLKLLVENMIETMRLNDGIGLAAPQVNVSMRLFVIDKKLINEEWDAGVYINPEIISFEGSELFEEGCLSIPGIRAEVERPIKIKVKYQNLKGKIIKEEMDGLLARVFQHEYDHLEGILFVDKIDPLIKKLLEPQIKELVDTNSY